MTKKYAFYTFTLLTGMIHAQHQELPFTEHFDYPENTELHANGNWEKLSGNEELDQIMIAPNSLTYPGLGESHGNSITYGGLGEDCGIRIVTQTTGTLYASFLFKVTDMSLFTSPFGGYTFGFGYKNNTGSYPWWYASTLHLKQVPESTTQFLIGTNRRTGSTETVWDTHPYDINETVFIVVSYDIDNKLSSMWINPSPSFFGAEEAPEPDLICNTGGTPLARIENVYIRQATQDQTPSVMYFDELRVGYDWAYVTPGAMPTSGLYQNEIPGLKLYPNPLREGILTIESDNQSDKTITVSDALGKQALVAEINRTIDLSQLQPGVYFVEISEQDKTAVKKLVIE